MFNDILLKYLKYLLFGYFELTKLISSRLEYIKGKSFYLSYEKLDWKVKIISFLWLTKMINNIETFDKLILFFTVGSGKK